MDSSLVPPENPDDWTDDQWQEYLKAEDEEIELDNLTHPVHGAMNKIAKSSGGQVLGSAMMGLHSIYYGKLKTAEIVMVTESPSEPENSIGRLILDDKDNKNPIFVLNSKLLDVEYSVHNCLISDAQEIAKLHYETWRTSYLNLVDDKILDFPTLESKKILWDKLIRDQNLPNRGPLVLKSGAKIVGVINIDKSKDEDSDSSTGEITNIYVDKNYSGKGGGKLLLSKGLEQCSLAGWDKVTLWVLENNTKARGFFENFGFRWDLSQRVDYIADLPIFEVRYIFDLKY
jgi:ribosomal protein S18 acetylase RimI-like enzyme